MIRGFIITTKTRNHKDTKDTEKVFAFFVLLFACTLLVTCDKIDRDNPWDEKAEPASWAPQNLEIELISLTERKLTWQYGDQNIEGFKIDRKEGDSEWKEAVARLGKEARSWDDTEIVPDTSLTYVYRVYAFAGNNESAKIEKITEVAFPAPTSLLITLNDASSLSLSWQYNNIGEDGFRIDRRVNDGELEKLYESLPANANTFTDVDVDLDQNRYSYMVYAYHGYYTSDYIQADYIPLAVTTHAVTMITLTSATSGGDVDGSHVDNCGIAYGTSPSPKVTDYTVPAENGQGSFSLEMTDLNPGTNYYVRAYASNNSGITYGQQRSFTTNHLTITDIDGNVYPTIIIGSQEWMAENLRVTRDANGNNITRYCYDYNPVKCELYGGLYTWPTVMNGQSSSSSNPSGVQGICPDGWHVPSDAEWTELVNYVVSQGYPNNNYDPNGAGNALKSCRQENSPLDDHCNTSEHPRWDSHSTHHGFDEFGFSALPGGNLSSGGSMLMLGIAGFWWSSTESSSSEAWSRHMSRSFGDVNHNYFHKPQGFSLRCVRNLDAQ